MENSNQQIAHIVNSEQYEMNRLKIAQMKEYIAAFETNNEVGHDSYRNMQQELQRRISEGEQAQQMLLAMRQSSVPTLYTDNSTSQTSVGHGQLPAVGTIEEVNPGSPYPPVPSGSKPPMKRSSPHITQGGASTSGYTGPPHYVNATQQPIYSQPSSTARNYNDARFPGHSAQPTSSSTGTRAATFKSIYRDTYVSNQSTHWAGTTVPPRSSAPPAIQTTPNDHPVQPPLTLAQSSRDAVDQDKKHRAYSELFSVIQPSPMKDVEMWIRRAWRSREEGIIETGLVRRIVDQLKPFSSNDAKEILFHLYKGCENLAAARNTKAIPRVASVQTPPTARSQPSAEPRVQVFTTGDVAEHSGQQSAQIEKPVDDETPATPFSCMSPEFLQKIRGVLRKLQEEKTSTKQAAEIIATVYETTYTRKKPENPLALWIIDTLQQVPSPVVQGAFKAILSQLGTPNTVIDALSSSAGQNASVATSSLGGQSITHSTSSLAGALDMPVDKPPQMAETNTSSNQSKAVQSSSAVAHLAGTSLRWPPAYRSTIYQVDGPANVQPPIVSSSGSAGPLQPQAQPMVITAASLPTDSAPVSTSTGSLELPLQQPPLQPVGSSAWAAPLEKPRRIPAEADPTRLAKDILKELGMPTGTVPALMTKGEKMNQRKTEKRMRDQEARGEVLRSSFPHAAPGLAQVIAEAQTTVETSDQWPLVGGSFHQWSIPTSHPSVVGSRVRSVPPVPAKVKSPPQPQKPVELTGLIQTQPKPQHTIQHDPSPISRLPTVGEEPLLKKSMPQPPAIPQAPTQPQVIPSPLSVTKPVTPPNVDAPRELLASKVGVQPSPSETKPVTLNQTSQRAITRDRSASEPAAEPLFLVSDSESDNIVTVSIPTIDKSGQELRIGASLLPSVDQATTSVLELGPQGKPSNSSSLAGNGVGCKNLMSLMSVIQSQSSANISDQTRKNVASSDREVRSDVGVTQKKVLKKNQFYIEVPPLPEWARKKPIWVRAERSEDKELDKTDEEADTEVDAEQQGVLDEAFSRLRSCPCRWRDCKIVLNCTNTLCKHLTIHMSEREGSHSFKCHWRDCTKRFKGLDSLEHHVVSDHARRFIPCAYQGCKYSFRKPHHLLDHNLTEHRNDSLKRSGLPFPCGGKPPSQALPRSMPSYLTAPIPVTQASISVDRHAKLGPWVLRQIYGPINTKRVKYNAATPLRNSRRIDKSKDNDQGEEAESIQIRYIRPDQYDFVDATAFGPDKIFDNLPTEAVSRDVADGMALLWGREADGINLTNAGRNADERYGDGESLLRATDVLQS